MSDTSETITIRLFRPDADVPPLVALLTAIAAGDKTGAVFDEATVHSQLAWLGHDPARDRWVAEAPGEGSQLIGHAWVFAQSPQRAILYGCNRRYLPGRECGLIGFQKTCPGGRNGSHGCTYAARGGTG